jgi:formylglycine-generating enzyme
MGVRIMSRILNTVALMAVLAAAGRAGRQAPREWTNSLGMKFVRIPAGSFVMGSSGESLPKAIAVKPHFATGDPDEKPAHKVRISKSLWMGAYEVTNAQYEQFDSGHRSLRGKLGFSAADDDAVVFVSWNDATAFCQWLSKKERRTYRLATEAEWEYAARAGTTTPFYTGDELPATLQKNQRVSWFPDPARRKPEDNAVPLRVGSAPANAWGLFDMAGNVEEWVNDWYGPYRGEEQRDPVGYVSGDFRVARGGSHSTFAYYLRSANRSGALPDDKSWLIGFRVVQGEMPRTRALGAPPAELWARDVDQTPHPRPAVPADQPYFRGPLEYVKIPPGSMGPLFSKHNHDPAIVECPNGDLLAIWYTCVEEPGRELGIAASRLRRGAAQWDDPSMFWNAPDRNDHAPALWFDGDRTIYHFNGMSAAATWGNLATILRTSTDNGRTWSTARIILSEHKTRQMPIESVFRTREGVMVLPCDAVSEGQAARRSTSAVTRAPVGQMRAAPSRGYTRV